MSDIADLNYHEKERNVILDGLLKDRKTGDLLKIKYSKIKFCLEPGTKNSIEFLNFLADAG